jgi:GT2 family glycosyltransferase
MSEAGPRVTVLLPVHNGEPYLRQAIESVLAQTLVDFELVVVDDASTDGTAATLASFTDSRIRVLRHEQNLGLVPSLNRGLREACGEYVARLDHDDYCLPTRLEHQAGLLDANPGVGLVGAWMDLVEAGGRRVGLLRSAIANYPEFIFQSLIGRVLIGHPSAMYRRAPVVDLGGYDESTLGAEDKDLWRRLALARWDARIVPEPLVAYRLHDRQSSQVRAAEHRKADARSQERFLAALSPQAPVRLVRLLLADDPAFWDECSDAGTSRAALAGLELLLADSRVRLELSPVEAARLERLVMGRLRRIARRGWRGRTMAFWRASPPLAVRGLHALPSSEALLAAAPYGAAYVSAPVLRIAWVAERRLASSVAKSRGVRRLRGPAQRSRLARVLYSKLTGNP